MSESIQPDGRRHSIAVVIVSAVLIRGLVAYWQIDSLTADPDAYGAIAVTIAESGVFGLTAPDGEVIPTAYRPPLYPWLLSITVVDGRWSLAAVATLHVLLGVATVALTYSAATRIVGSAGIVAAGLVAVDPILLLQSTQVMTETLATLLSATVIWWWVRAYPDLSRLPVPMVLGVLLSLSFLCRPTFLVWACLLAVALAFVAGLTIRRRMRQALVFTAIVGLTVTAWTTRNAVMLGSPIWATSHGGYTLLLGNNPLFYDYLRQQRWMRAWDAERFSQAYLHRYQSDPRQAEFWEKDWNQTPPRLAENVSEADDDRLAYESARATIDREPRMFLWSGVVRVARLWSPVPHLGPGRPAKVVVAVGLFYGITYLMVVIGLWRWLPRLFSPVGWPIWTLLVTLTVVHAVYWSNLRMRAPAVPGIAMLAAAGISRRWDAKECG